MNIRRRLKTNCTVTNVTSGDPDEYNNPTEVAATPIRTVCWLMQTGNVTGRTETTGLSNTAAENYTCYFPSGTRIDTRAIVTILAGPNAGDWQVDGPPWKAENPLTGRGAFVAATVGRVT